MLVSDHGCHNDLDGLCHRAMVLSGPGLMNKAMSASVAQQKPGSKLMSVAPVILEICKCQESGQTPETMLVSESDAAAGAILIW